MKNIFFNTDFVNEVPIIIIIGIVLVVSFLVTNRMIPMIIRTVHFKKLMVRPNGRSSHSRSTPTLGGVAFFASIIISIFLIQKFDNGGISVNLMVALTILFFLGLKDDLMVLSSTTKILMQSTAIFFIIWSSDFMVVNLHGFAGVNEIPIWLGVPLSYFAILYIINAYNLFDGIDGLAGMLGILISSIFAVIFYSVEEYFYALLAFSIIGFLISFLRYNLSERNKIFMGDTGSMIVGFLIALLSMRFLSLEGKQLEQIYILPGNALIVLISILFFPVIDVIRVMLSRFLKRMGIFDPDRGHIHHIFIDKGLGHFEASIILVICGLFVFVFIYLANMIVTYLVLFTGFMFLSILTFYLLLLLDKHEIAIKHRKEFRKHIPERIYRIEFRIRKGVILFLKKLFFRDLL